MAHGRRGAGWRFARHDAQMVVAMFPGTAVMGMSTRLLGKPPGFDATLGRYAYMGVAMAAPMVCWVRRIGHPRRDCGEMTAAMVAPMYALALPVAVGALPMGESALMLWSHVAVLGGMLLLMLCRWDTYAGEHCRTGHAPAAEGA